MQSTSCAESKRCYTGNCGPVNVKNGICEKITGNWCKPAPCGAGCEQYAHLRLRDPPNNVNLAYGPQDSVLFDLSGGMSLYNGAFRPTHVPAYGGGTEHLPTFNPNIKRYTHCVSYSS